MLEWKRPKEPRQAALLLMACAVCRPGPAAPDRGAEQLTILINAYRAAPGSCAGRAASPAAPLAPEAALAKVRVGPGTIIEAALERAGYAAERADAISVTGPQDAKAALDAIRQQYCSTLLSTRYSAIGAHRAGGEWTVVLARPAPPPPTVAYPDWPDAGLAILAGVNAARAAPRTCGEQPFPPAPPLSWNAALGEAALAHSRDMAARRYLSHKAGDGSVAADRAQRAGYGWRHVGENIAFGQHSPEEVVAGWLSSPGHCANIMHRAYTEMGAAYGVALERRTAVIYWTQVFGARR